MEKEIEQDIRIEARNWCGPIETDRGASENQVENVALHFFEKGWDEHSKAVDEKADYTLSHLVGINKLDAKELVLSVKNSQQAFEEGYEKGQKDKLIKNQPCKICKKPDDYSEETICHECIEKWKEKLEEKERGRTLIEIGNSLDEYNGISSRQKLRLFKCFKLNPLAKDFGLVS